MSEKQQKAQMRSFSMVVNIDCEGCRRKVHKVLQKMQGLQEVSVNASQNKVSVKGTVEPEKVMKKLARNTGKHVQMWKEEEQLNQIKNQEKDSSNKENTKLIREQQEYNYYCSPFTWEEVACDENSYMYSSNSFLLYEETQSISSCIIM